MKIIKKLVNTPKKIINKLISTPCKSSKIRELESRITKIEAANITILKRLIQLSTNELKNDLVKQEVATYVKGEKASSLTQNKGEPQTVVIVGGDTNSSKTLELLGITKKDTKKTIH